jgi:AcrR family transcriptional regulator
MAARSVRPRPRKTDTPAAANGAEAPAAANGAEARSTANGAQAPAAANGAEAQAAAARAQAPTAAFESERAQDGSAGRYRRLPTGAHGLAREEVERDQRERLQLAMIELIFQRGYRAVRILDLTQLAHVSRPTFYGLYTDKEELLLGAYDDISLRTAKTVMKAYDTQGPPRERLEVAMRAFAQLAAGEPEAMSLFLFGAFGAGPKALEHRNRRLEAFERSIESSRDGGSVQLPGDLTVKVILGGIREIAAARLREHRASELPGLADEFSAWAASYPPRLPANLGSPAPWRERGPGEAPDLTSERARRAEGRLPSGRHDLPREVVVKSQRERIVDATAAIVAEKGLADLTIPEIASRANVSHETFYEMYPTKQDAFLGAQKVGMHQAFLIAVEAYELHKQEDWARGIAEGIRALVAYLCSEPAHAHLSFVDTFAASPETLEIRDEILRGFAVYFGPGERPPSQDIDVPAIAAEAVVGGVWQILHYYIENKRFSELLDATPQLTYLLLTPFLGPKAAAKAALRTHADVKSTPAGVNGA